MLCWCCELCPSVENILKLVELLREPPLTSDAPEYTGGVIAREHMPAVHVVPSSQTLPTQHGSPANPQVAWHTPIAHDPPDGHARPHMPQFIALV